MTRRLCLLGVLGTALQVLDCASETPLVPLLAFGLLTPAQNYEILGNGRIWFSRSSRAFLNA
jgi:hypothetical protein